jgi:hypothetical protein
VLIGFPLHPAGRPGIERAAHLQRIRIPMLFIQGTCDALAELELLQPIVAQLGEGATLFRLEDADHALHVRASSGRGDSEAQREWLDVLSGWVSRVI